MLLLANGKGQGEHSSAADALAEGISGGRTESKQEMSIIMLGGAWHENSSVQMPGAKEQHIDMCLQAACPLWRPFPSSGGCTERSPT